ncbi:MAG: hypothetical protein JOZ77_10660 [Candidatus Eremiobacteraeota bacterium]|nr:hypothetical protein [Candidatus Eremiobacteraeota bacterium]
MRRRIARQRLNRSFALSGCALAALLSGCGNSFSGVATPSTIAAAGIASHQKTFSYVGAEQSFKVPAGVTKITVVASGAGGPSGKRYVGGNGGRVKATIPVTPGEKLAVFVGGEGGASGGASGGSGGFNGGGTGGIGHFSADGGSGGGGASDIRQNGDGLSNRVLVAGGGGGSGGYGNYGYGDGGAGGGPIGANGGGDRYRNGPSGFGGRGGTQKNGGRGGRASRRDVSQHGDRGQRGSLGLGGSGGGSNKSGGGGGGGAGGGYYGGGGGGSGSSSTSGEGGGGGGAGGSSFTEASATRVKNLRGAAPPGNGRIVISW